VKDQGWLKVKPKEIEHLDDAKLYRTDVEKVLVPFVPKNQYNSSSWRDSPRLLVSTSEDRIEVFKRTLDLYPGPFFITIAVQEPHGSLKRRGRLYGDKGKTRIQIEFLLDYFHDYISYNGMMHFWVTCESTDGIVVYDNMDQFYIYGRVSEAEKFFAERGYINEPIDRNFEYAHCERVGLTPGTEDLKKFGKWGWLPLEWSDVPDPYGKSFKNLYLRFRHWKNDWRKKSK
jgi:hypothetical protein